MANVSTFPPGPIQSADTNDELMFDGAQRRKRGAIVIVSFLVLLITGFVTITILSRALH